MTQSARDRRLAIEASLRHEADTLTQIKGQMEQADRATLAMSSFRIHLSKLNHAHLSIKNTFKSRETLFNSILSSFGTRLDKLEKAVIPVHRQTVELQQLQASGGLKCSISL